MLDYDYSILIIHYIQMFLQSWRFCFSFYLIVGNAVNLSYLVCASCWPRCIARKSCASPMTARLTFRTRTH